jgi:hypothetical protein
MAAIATPTLGTVAGEQRMLLNGVSWEQYVLLRDELDVPGLKLTYCEGTLELKSPSFGHHYDRVERSHFLPELDFALIARLTTYPDQLDALDELRRLVGGSDSTWVDNHVLTAQRDQL